MGTYIMGNCEEILRSVWGDKVTMWLTFKLNSNGHQNNWAKNKNLLYLKQ